MCSNSTLMPSCPLGRSGGPPTITQFSDVTDPSGYVMFWDAVSPITGADVWVNVGGQETPDHTGIQVQLNHFSEYAPGKAGW